MAGDRLTPETPAFASASAINRSERLYDDEDHDADHEHRRHLVPEPVEAGGTGVAVLGEVFEPAYILSVQGGHGDNQGELAVKPARLPPATGEDEVEAEDPARDHGRVDDRLEEPLLHDLEGLRAHRALLGVGVIDEEPRQIAPA